MNGKRKKERNKQTEIQNHTAVTSYHSRETIW